MKLYYCLHWLPHWTRQSKFEDHVTSLVSWGCGTHRLHLCRGVRSFNGCLRYDIKQTDGESLVLKLWGMWNIVAVAVDRVLSMGQIELFDYLNCMQTDAMLNRIVRNRSL